MGFFGRLATLIKSNLNDLISKSEDPEKMLNQVIVDMNQQLVEAKKQVAVAIADEKRLQKQYNNEKSVVDEWHQSHVPGRDASALDVLTDVTGVACVVWIVAFLGREDATERGLRARFALGLGLCLVAALASTFLG